MFEFLRLLTIHLREDIKKPKVWGSLIVSGIVAIVEGSIEHRFYVAFNDWQDQQFRGVHMDILKPVIFSPFLLIVLVVCWILIQAARKTREAPNVEPNDPRILVHFIDERKDQIFKKTALILTNTGGSEAMDVQISQIELRGEKIWFPRTVGVMAPQRQERFDPKTQGQFGSVNTALFVSVLMSEWDTYRDAKLTALSFPLTIKYQNFARTAEFETNCEMHFYPYREIRNRRSSNPQPIIEFLSYGFKKTPSSS